jgi:hypothetical protein
MLEGSPSGCLADNPNPSLIETAGPLLDDDLHVLPKGCQEPHQAIGGEVREATVEQCRHFRLVDAHERGSGHLGQPSSLDEPCATGSGRGTRHVTVPAQLSSLEVFQNAIAHFIATASRRMACAKFVTLRFISSSYQLY